MPSYVKSHIRLFADDSYLYRTIETMQDTLMLQNDLERLQEWEKLWDMEFHPQKCKVLKVTNKTKPIKSSYFIHGEKLECVDNAKYLGVTLNKKLRWNTHVADTCKKANQKRMFLQRNLRNCSKKIKANAYKLYVKPITTYASPVWNPVGISNTTLCTQIEKVQRKAARFVFADWSWQSSPSEMMKDLTWKSLENERKINNILMLHKIAHRKVIVPPSFLPKRNRDLVKFQPVHGRVNAYSNSFIPTTVKWWNDLPGEVISIEDFDQFRSKIVETYSK